MEYIVPSIGRSGSTLVTRLICEATGRTEGYTQDLFQQHLVDDGTVKKTHAHFVAELPYEYRAVYTWGDVGDVLSSMFSGRVNLPVHLEHLEVDVENQIAFWEMLDRDADEAFAFLVEGDRLRLWENIRSWALSERVLFVEYERLCSDKNEVLAAMREHTGLALPDFDVKPRVTGRAQLSPEVRALVDDVYAGFGPPASARTA